ncbi:MAG TPA: YrdB family protein [Symbiobacteriaceae bacterium]|nr:YrdB family protein [Symbiobacteriaceae bacterium]
MLQGANLGVRFLLEICALVGLGYWGFRTGNGGTARYVLGIGAPLLAAVVWGMFVAPKASIPVSGAVRMGLELVIFGSAAAALWAVGRTGLAAAFALVAVISRVLMIVWRQ